MKLILKKSVNCVNCEIKLNPVYINCLFCGHDQREPGEGIVKESFKDLLKYESNKYI